MATAPKTYPLADMIEALAADLREANRRATAETRGAVLVLKEAQVELGFTWTQSGTGGLDIKVVKLEGNVTRDTVQTMTVTMWPAPQLGDLPSLREIGLTRDKPFVVGLNDLTIPNLEDPQG